MSNIPTLPSIESLQTQYAGARLRVKDAPYIYVTLICIAAILGRMAWAVFGEMGGFGLLVASPVWLLGLGLIFAIYKISQQAYARDRAADEFENRLGLMPKIDVKPLLTSTFVTDLSKIYIRRYLKLPAIEDVSVELALSTVAQQKIAKLKADGFAEYAATCLRKGSQYCIVGDLGDVRYTGDSK